MKVISLLLSSLLLSAAIAVPVFSEELPFELDSRFEAYDIGSSQSIDSGLYIYYEGNNNGYKNLAGEVVIEPVFTYADEFSEGLAFVRKGEVLLGGYIDTKGTYIIPPVFSDGQSFRDGKAIVKIYDSWQIINKKGEFLLSKKYDYFMHYDDRSSYYICKTKDYKTDIYDKELNLLKSIDYDAYDIVKVKDKYFLNTTDEKGLNYIVSFDTGKAILSGNQNEYYINTDDFFFAANEYLYSYWWYNIGGSVCYDINGDIFSDYGFDGITVLDENTYFGFYYSEDEGYDSYIVENGQKKSFEYPIIDAVSDDFLIAYNAGNNVGIVNKAGEIIVPFSYEYFLERVNDKIAFAKGNTRDVYSEDDKLIKTIEDVQELYYQGEYYYCNKGDGTYFENLLLDENFDEYLSIKGTEDDTPYIWCNNGIITVNYKERTYAVVEKDKFKVQEYPEMTPVKYDASNDLKKFKDEKMMYMKLRNFKCYENDEFKLLDTEVPTTKPYLENSLTMVPISLISRIFDTYCWYNEYTNKVQINYNNKHVVLNVGSNVADVSTLIGEDIVDSRIILPANVRILDGRTMVPLRAVSELLDKYVFWDDSGLIGVSNTELKPTAEEISRLNAGFSDYKFIPDELQRIDASLATQPFADYFSAKVLNVDSAVNVALYSNTIPGYEALITKTKDVILVTEPSEEMLLLAAQAGVELEVTPFSKEGFVFLVNSENKIDDLTVEQLKGIYKGEILNWESVGGGDLEIKAYQRNENSGSQTIMENFFMKDEAMTDPISRKVESMMGLIDVISEYDENINGGIGYSVYYYAKTMYGSDKIRLLKVNGVEPTSETIRDNSYPLIVNYYIVTRKDDASESTRRLKEYLLSQEGQKYVDESGLVSIVNQ